MKSFCTLWSGTLSVLFVIANVKASTVRIAHTSPVPEGGDAPQRITLVRSGDASFAFTVDYVLGDNSARAGIDFHPQSGTLRLEAGETTKQFQLPNPVIDNSAVDGPRSIRIELTNASAGVLVEGSAFVEIEDNELPNILDQTFRFHIQTHRLLALADGPDGRILTLIGTNIVRLMPNGGLDSTFQYYPIEHWDLNWAGAFPQANGHWVVWLQRQEFGELQTGDIFRLRANGSIDSAFEPTAWLSRYFGGTNVWFHKSAVQSNGQLLVQIGDFSGRSAVVRLNLDGSRDEQFTAITNLVAALVVQRDDRIVAAHQIPANNPVQLAITRYHQDGAADPSFQHSAVANNSLHALALQSDDKILLAGNFPTIVEKDGSTIIRLMPDGSRDLSFQTDFIPAHQIEMFVLPSDQVVVQYDSAPGVYRYRPDGSLDAQIPMSLHAPKVLLDGRLLIRFIAGFGGQGLMRFDLTDATRPGVMFGEGYYDIPSYVALQILAEGLPQEDLPPARIRRLGDTSKPLTITASTRDGTATGGEDFVPLSRKITFAPLEVEKSLSFRWLDDSKFEPDEHFYLVLAGSDVAGQGELEVRIGNDDPGAILDSPRLNGEETAIPIIAIDNFGQWEVQASFDLKNWAIANFTLQTNLFGVLEKAIDPGAFSHPQRFYRLIRR